MTSYAYVKRDGVIGFCSEPPSPQVLIIAKSDDEALLRQVIGSIAHHDKVAAAYRVAGLPSSDTATLFAAICRMQWRVERQMVDEGRP